MSVDKEKYQEFLTRIQPVAVELNSSTVRIDRPKFWGLFSETPAGIEHWLDAGYTLDSKTDDTFNVIGRMSVRVGDKKTPAIAFECEFSVHFNGAKKGDDEFVKVFGGSEVRLILWPYFRELLSASTARMGVPPLFLPLTLRQVSSAPDQPMEKPSATTVREPSKGRRSRRKRSRA